jgi:hypothetical protein
VQRKKSSASLLNKKKESLRVKKKYLQKNAAGEEEFDYDAALARGLDFASLDRLPSR